MFRVFKKIFIIILLGISSVNVNGINPYRNYTETQFLLPMKFWYNASAVTFRDLTNLLADVNFNLMYFSDKEHFSKIKLVRVNNHIIVTTEEHTDDIHISGLVPFENPYLKFLINSLKENNRLDIFRVYSFLNLMILLIISSISFRSFIERSCISKIIFSITPSTFTIGSS